MNQEKNSNIKNVQIPLETFLKLVRYFLLEQSEKELYEQIQKDIKVKLDNLVKHELYTKSKIAKTMEEREKARQEYLEKIGLTKNFRW